MKLKINITMDPLLLLRQSIKSRGLKDTAQREGIVRFLAGVKGHLTQEEIFDAVRKQEPRMGRATVFRTIKLLEEIGLVTRVTFADGVPRYEYAHGRPHHDHMICVACGDALEFTSPAIERLQARLAKDRKFEVRWHRHEMFGLCARCAGKKQP